MMILPQNSVKRLSSNTYRSTLDKFDVALMEKAPLHSISEASSEYADPDCDKFVFVFFKIFTFNF